MEQELERSTGISRKVEFSDSEALGFLVIDSLLGGGGTGGIRFGAGVTENEVTELAREMSLKFAWLNIPRGGAKSGIRCGENVDDKAKARILREFGSAIADLLTSGEYVPGMDLGVGPTELAEILAGARINRSEPTGGPEIDSNFFTALTVFVALATLLEGRKKRVCDMTFLIEGVGKVGRNLIRLVDRAGGTIVGVSTIKGAAIDQNGLDADRLLELADRYGDDFVSHVSGATDLAPTELYFQSADVLVPGARTNSIKVDDVKKLRARFIVPIANAVASQPAEDLMHRRGISYLPGFVSNSGGIFCWYLALLSADCRESIIRRGLAKKIRRLISEADSDNVAIAALARDQANSKASRMALESRGPIWWRLSGLARKLGPRKIGYLVLRRLLGNNWARKDSILCRWYFDAKYFS